MKDIAMVRPQTAVDTWQRLPSYIGVSEGTCGSTGISMNMIVIPPSAAAEPHVHTGFETAVYLLQGKVGTKYGPGLSKSVINGKGDFIFIPAGVPHQPCNLSDTEPALAIVARNAPDEQESVQAYDPERGTAILFSKLLPFSDDVIQ